MIKTLNGIRALLFLFIFGAHFKYVIAYSELGAKLFNFFNLARFAILAFVLLSGFCIALGYTDKFNALSKENFIVFIKKRFLKLYPLYFISGLVGLLFIYLPMGIKWLYLFIFVYVPMLTIWLGIDAGGNINGWFIDSIFFCYLLTPNLLFWFNKKRNLKFHIKFCIINYLILAIFSIILVLLRDPNNEYLYRFPVIRAFEFAIALDIGFIFTKLKHKIQLKNPNNYLHNNITDIVFILLFLLIMYILPNNLLSRHVFGIPLILAFIVYMSIEKRSFLQDIFNSKFLNFLGNLSFECYLIHYLVIEFLKPYVVTTFYTGVSLVMLYLKLLCLTICFAYLYKKVETSIKNKLSFKI